MGSSFGTLFRITTWGESHGPGLGVVVEGCPPRLPLEARDVQVELDRRRPGQSRITTQRREQNRVEIVSGVYDGLTLGTPIGMSYVPIHLSEPGTEIAVEIRGKSVPAKVVTLPFYSHKTKKIAAPSTSRS